MTWKPHQIQNVVAEFDENGTFQQLRSEDSGTELVVPTYGRDSEGNAIQVVDANGNRFAMLPLDANGNVLANVGHRQNTLTNLLALDGVPGEISVATDADALVVHTGVAGQAKAYRRDTLIARSTCTVTSTQASLGQQVYLNLSSTVYGTQGIIDGAAESILIPTDAYWGRFSLSGRVQPLDGGANLPQVGDYWRIFFEEETGVGTGSYLENSSYGGALHVAQLAELFQNYAYFSSAALLRVQQSAGRRLKIRLDNLATRIVTTLGVRLGVEFYSLP